MGYQMREDGTAGVPSSLFVLLLPDIVIFRLGWLFPISYSISEISRFPSFMRIWSQMKRLSVKNYSSDCMQNAL